ncbi:MAG TPA: hypothetical protein VIE69_07050 [Methylophilaceae bacterium]|jgi:hypothetical protein
MEILLKGGMTMISIALVMAWMGTFARWFVIKGLEGGIIKDYGLLVKAHIDFILMSLFCFAFYAVAKSSGITLPTEACWLVVIGGITNPTVFVIAMLKPNHWEYTLMKIYTAASFIITTTGFFWIIKTIANSL